MKSILKQLREKNKKSVNDIASVLGVSRSYYNKLENLTEVPSEKRLIKLAEIFEINPDVLRQEHAKNRAVMNAYNHWIGKIKVKEMSAIEAYKKEHFFERYNLSDEEIISKFINFIAIEIRDSLKNEIYNDQSKNNYLKFFVLEKLKNKKLMESF